MLSSAPGRPPNSEGNGPAFLQGRDLAASGMVNNCKAFVRGKPIVTGKARWGRGPRGLSGEGRAGPMEDDGMKRIMLTALALAMTIATMAGCSSDDKADCNDVCGRLEACDESLLSRNECISWCQQAFDDGDIGQDDLDCVKDARCGDVFNQCGIRHSCKEACSKLDNCDLLGVSISECNNLCEDEATQGEIDCVVDNACGDIFDRC